MVDLMSAEN